MNWPHLPWHMNSFSSRVNAGHRAKTGQMLWKAPGDLEGARASEHGYMTFILPSGGGIGTQSCLALRSRSETPARNAGLSGHCCLCCCCCCFCCCCCRRRRRIGQTNNAYLVLSLCRSARFEARRTRMKENVDEEINQTSLVPRASAATASLTATVNELS